MFDQIDFAGTPAGYNDRLLSFADARKLVGISRSKIYLLMQEKAFPAPAKVGKSNFFSEREIQDWIKAQLAQRPRANQGR